ARCLPRRRPADPGGGTPAPASRRPSAPAGGGADRAGGPGPGGRRRRPGARGRGAAPRRRARPPAHRPGGETGPPPRPQVPGGVRTGPAGQARAATFPPDDRRPRPGQSAAPDDVPGAKPSPPGWRMTAAVAQVIWLGLGAMVTCYLLIGTGYAAVHFAWESRMVLRVRDHDGPSPDPVPATPAYRSYPLRQAWRDARVLLGRAGRGWWEDLAGLHHRFWGWFRGTSAAKQLLSLPLGVSLVVGTALVVAPVAAGALTVLIGLTAGVLLWGVGLLLLAGTLGVADAALRVSHRIVVACPHPGCYHRFRRPAYACPADGCGQRHPALRPGRAGLLRHACRCGAALPTLMVLGRYRLTGYCPRCHRPLPRRAGRLRIEHVPVVGGPDAGKTTFLCLAIGALDQRITATGGVVEYTDERDQQRWRAALAALRGGER